MSITFDLVSHIEIHVNYMSIKLESLETATSCYAMCIAYKFKSFFEGKWVEHNHMCEHTCTRK